MVVGSKNAHLFGVIVQLICFITMTITALRDEESVTTNLRFPLTNSQMRHERNLIWSQKETDPQSNARIVGVNGDPNMWVTNRTATTRYITAPNDQWDFIGLAFNYATQSLYWSDSGNKKIQAIYLNGSKVAFTVFAGISSQVQGLAVDTIGGNIYWTDALYNWIIVTPAVKESSHFKILISTGLDKPMGIVVHSEKGLLFWSDWGSTPCIEQSSLSGDNRHKLVETGLRQPVGITIDYKENRLYWVDRYLGTVDSISLGGTHRLTNFQTEGSNFFGIALYQDFVFLTDQQVNQLFVYNRRENKHEVNFSLGSSVPYGIIMYQERTEEIESPGCQQAGCQHICVSKGAGAVSCICASGFRLADDGQSCVDDGKYKTPQFIYSIGTALCRYPGNMPDMYLLNISLDTQCFMTHRRDAMALTFSLRHNSLFFSENKTRTISAVKLVEGQGPEIIIGGTGQVEGLAIDWLANNLYWTDSTYRQVLVARADGRHQHVLHQGHLHHPRGIAVDAINRYLFWTDIGAEPRIERSNLDGSSRVAIVTENIMSPNHLSVDYLTDRLYWSDSTAGKIEWLSLKGEERGVAMFQPQANFYGITTFQDFIVWTDWGEKNGIHAGLKETGEKVRGIVHPGVGKAYDVITYDEMMQPLAEGPCNKYSNCEQLCLPGRDVARATCGCALGYTEAGDGVSCVTDALYDNFLVVSDTYQKQVYQMSVQTGDFHAVPLTTQDNPIAVDYDPIRKKLYWSDVATHVIKRANLNGSQEETVRILSQGSIADGLAVDSISRLVYYTDTGRKLIVVMNLTGGNHVILIKNRLQQPRAIVVDPSRGHMFWTDWGLRSRIEKAYMDGSRRRVIINTGVGAWPNGLAIDTTAAKLYWCDARSDRIERSDLQGRHRAVIYQATNSHFFGLAVLGGTVYFTDWTKRSVMKLERQEDGHYDVSAFGPTVFSRMNGITVYSKSHSNSHTNTDVGINACSFHNGMCSYLCLPVPNGRRCSCPSSTVLTDNGYQCSQITVSDINKMDHTPSPASSNKTPSKAFSMRPSSWLLDTFTRSLPASTKSTVSQENLAASVLGREHNGTQGSTPATLPNVGASTANPHNQRSPTTSQKYHKFTDTSNPSSATQRTIIMNGSKTIDGLEGGHSDHDLTPSSLNSYNETTKVTSANMTNISESVDQRTAERDSRGFNYTPLNNTEFKSTRANITSWNVEDSIGLSMVGLLSIIIAGLILTLLVIIIAVVIYRKMDTRSREPSRRATVANWHDTIEMPVKDAIVPAPAQKYDNLNDVYYTGEVDSGVENLAFTSRDSITTYAEIVQDCDRPTFKTFLEKDDT